MKPKYKIGDKVKVKSIRILKTLAIDTYRDGTLELPSPGWNSSMQRLCGNMVTIQGIYSSARHDYTYTIKEDKGNWTWVDWMFNDDCTDEVHDIFRKLLT